MRADNDEVGFLALGRLDDLLAVNKGMGLTTLISFLLVAIAVMIGLGSGRRSANLSRSTVTAYWTAPAKP